MATPETSEQILGEQHIATLDSHCLAEQARNPGTTGTLSWILSAISFATKSISAKLRRARLDNVLGSVGTQNVQGEVQQKLDVIANELLLRCLADRDGVAVVASEENEEPVIIRDDVSSQPRYCVLFDPLDGSSNLDVAGGVGTIFSILRHERGGSSTEAGLLQPGEAQVAAGYVLYGSSTVLTLTTGNGVHLFVLDPAVGDYIRVAQNLQIPTRSKQYSLNEGNRLSLPRGYQDYLRWVQDNGYSSRYVGAMVADVHRVMIKGGVFMYPPTDKAPAGKLRLMYEANPMAMLVEQAGGKAMAGTRRLMEVAPSALHQRTPVILGSAEEVDRVVEFIARSEG
jgi:fructose-1,6-bisphosphatase I